jgi:mono/diheme cytochrome c family protein
MIIKYRRWTAPLAVLAGAGALAGLTMALVAAEKKKVEIDLSKLPPAAQQEGVTYAKEIRPIFEAHCFKCHGPKKHKSKLRLDSLASALKGGDDGPDIVPHQSTKSPLLINIAQIGDSDDYMPPPSKGKKLLTAQIALIRAWIDQGAK